jgi:hypothetical protein
MYAMGAAGSVYGTASKRHSVFYAVDTTTTTTKTTLQSLKLILLRGLQAGGVLIVGEAMMLVFRKGLHASFELELELELELDIDIESQLILYLRTRLINKDLSQPAFDRRGTLDRLGQHHYFGAIQYIVVEQRSIRLD